jgi:hypothetical protein
VVKNDYYDFALVCEFGLIGSFDYVFHIDFLGVDVHRYANEQDER